MHRLRAPSEAERKREKRKEEEVRWKVLSESTKKLEERAGDGGERQKFE